MSNKIKYIVLCLIVFLPILLTLIYSPLLRAEYLVDCRGAGPKTFMGCTVDQSSRQYMLDGVLQGYIRLALPFIIIMGSVVILRRAQTKSTILYFTPILILCVALILMFLYKLLFWGGATRLIMGDYLLSVSFSYILYGLVSIVVLFKFVK